MADIKAIAEALVGMTTEEVQNLAKVLKDEYGITAGTSGLERQGHVAMVEGGHDGQERLVPRPSLESYRRQEWR